jgi:Holliday junction resolvase RusA-like endonuclease
MRILAIDPGPAEVTFWVPGIPKPGGSKRGFLNPKTGHVIITEACKGSRDWRNAVASAAYEQIPNWLPGPLRVAFSFYFPRPACHYGSGKNANRLRDSAPMYPTGRPDVTKLVRSTEDALKGIAWRDDSQVVDQIAQKRYAHEGKSAGAQITITLAALYPLQIDPVGERVAHQPGLALAVIYGDRLAEEK